MFSLAESLGGVESLIEVPQAMTHGSVEGSAAAVPADLVRLSCGIEAPEDLVEDLEQAIGVEYLSRVWEFTDVIVGGFPYVPDAIVGILV